MRYLAKSFSSRPSTKAYRDNFDETFRSDRPEDETEKILDLMAALKSALKPEKKKPSKGTK